MPRVSNKVILESRISELEGLLSQASPVNWVQDEERGIQKAFMWEKQVKAYHKNKEQIDPNTGLFEPEKEKE